MQEFSGFLKYSCQSNDNCVHLLFKIKGVQLYYTEWKIQKTNLTMCPMTCSLYCQWCCCTFKFYYHPFSQLVMLSIHSFISLSYNRSKASSPYSAIQSFLLQMRVSSPFLKVLQQLPMSSSSSSCHFYPPFYLSFNNPLQKAVSTQNVTNPVSGVPRNFVRGREVQQIQLRTERTGIWKAVAPQSGVLKAAVIWYKKFHFIW